MGQSETKNSRGGVTGKQVRGNYVESSKAIYWDGRSENGEYVSKLRLKYKVDVMVQRVIILLLVMVVILAGCSEEDDLGGVAKVSGTLPPIGSQIDLVRSISI